ncbi:MAG: HEAT repeat domain-containing protein [Planctomycetales bacterium]|nr:HEAT repeat domain-containing protein [Planctomycetales bacterium]
MLGCEGEEPAIVDNGVAGEAPATVAEGAGGATGPATNFSSVAAAIDALTTATDAHDRTAQMAAYTWLCSQGEPALAQVVAATNDGSRSLEARRMTCRVLPQLGPASAAPLIEISKGSDGSLALKAIESMAAVKRPPPALVQHLLKLVDSDNEQVRRSAIRSLGGLGTAAKAAADKLQALRNSVDENETIRGEADRSLKLVRPIRTFND